MPIRITCAACRTTMRVPEGFTEPKKVRCTQCGILMLLTPDPTKTDGVNISIPRKTGRSSDPSAGPSQWLVLGAIAAGIVVLLFVLWWFFRT